MLQKTQIDLNAMLAGEVSTIPINGTYTPSDTQDINGVSLVGDVLLQGDITNRAGYIRLALTAEVDYSTACARCLKPIEGRFSVQMDKTVAARGTLADEDADEVIEDYILIENGILDLAQVTCEHIELELPYRFLCREDCKGLCSKCGKDLNQGDCDCQKKELDPRMAPLRALLEEYKKS